MSGYRAALSAGGYQHEVSNPLERHHQQPLTPGPYPHGAPGTNNAGFQAYLSQQQRPLTPQSQASGHQQQSTPGGSHLHAQAMSAHTRQQLENHIQSKPFNFNSLPPGLSGLRSLSASNINRPNTASPSSNNVPSPLGPSSVASHSQQQQHSMQSLGPPGSSGGSSNSAAAKNNDAGDTSADGGAGANTPGTGPANKGRQPGGASDFVKKLYKMLEEDNYKNVVIWGANGDSFVVKDMNEFTKTVLPQHFKHSNFASFVRQLNKYDFHKVKNPEGQGDATGDNFWEFKHPSFSTDQKYSLENIRRKITTAKKPETPGTSGGPSGPILGGALNHPDEIALLHKQINVLTHNQKQIELHMGTFTQQYNVLMADLIGQHKAIAAQDAFTATTLQYIINLESRLLALTNPSDPPTYPPSQEAQHLMAAYSELSRARYDKMTESTRRAEALGLFNSNGPQGYQQQPQGIDSPIDDGNSSDLSRNNMPTYLQPRMPIQQQHRQHPTNSPHSQVQAHPSQNNSFFQYGNQNLNSPTTSNTEMPLGANARPYNLGGTNSLLNTVQQQQHQQHHQQQHGEQGSMDSYFPAPGSAPIRPSMAITPGAVMVSTLNTQGIPNNQNQNKREQSESDGDFTPNLAESALTAANTENNRTSNFTPETEDIAAFAAALKGGQSSAAVRSALTSQPILVRRATYIPGWSVPPRVLLVEDDAVCRNLTTKFLQIFGCTIDVAADGVEAVNKMQTGVYDICMMDVSMPNLDGVSATSLIRQFDAMTPIISMTGNSRPDEVLTYFSHGMNDVLPKPFTKEGMLSMLEKHLIHLKQIHRNPEMAPNNDFLQNLQNFDPQNFDPNNGVNPFFELGVSNEDYQSMLSGNTPTRLSITSPSPGPHSAGNPGKRGQDGQDGKDPSKRTRFED